jgi:hypothetical protein
MKLENLEKEDFSDFDSVNHKIRFPRNLDWSGSFINKFTRKIHSKSLSSSQKLGTPKKEYLRCKLIRGFKKCIRLLSKYKTQKLAKKFCMGNEETWNNLYESYLQYKEILQENSSAKIMVSNKCFKSYNYEFCRAFFSVLEIRITFFFYIENIFFGYNPKKLCKEFKFFCCNEFNHTEDCSQLWENLKIYIQNILMSELGYGPLSDSVIKNCELQSPTKSNRNPDEITQNIIKNLPIYLKPTKTASFTKPVLPNALNCSKKPVYFDILNFEHQPKWIQKLYFQSKFYN